MRQTQKLINLHAHFIKEFSDIQEACSDEREQCVSDRRFTYISGAQWESELKDQFKNKPKFEINKAKKAVDRIINEYKNNRITVDFISKTGNQNDKLADTCDRLFRSDEQDSSAPEAYDNAMYEAVPGGMGAWRLIPCYEDEYDVDNDKQRIKIEPIYDADTSVFFDLGAKEYDKSDAKMCFVITSFTKEAAEEEFGEDVTTINKELSDGSYFDWTTPDLVYIAEVYKVEEVKESVYIYKTIDGEEEKYKDEDFENDKELEDTLSSIGTLYERERKIKTRRVRKYIMCGNHIIDDCGYIAGKNIPIVPLYGTRVYIDNIERLIGEVRTTKDLIRLNNMQMSKLAEVSSLSSVEKPILTPEQIMGHTTMWKDDNVENWPYLLINPIKDVNGNKVIAPPVGYTKVPNIPPAMAALLQLTDTNIKELLGSMERGEELTPNLSGTAVTQVQNRLDVQTFNYMSNLSKSMIRSGEIWQSMAKEIYVETGREMKGVLKDGSMTTVELNMPVIDKETMATVSENNLADADLKVVASVGPSSSSSRQSTIRSLMSMLQFTQDPETVQVLTSMALMNMEGEGMSDVQDYFRNKMLRIGATKPTDEEKERLEAEAANQEEDPQAIALKGMAEESTAKAAKARADTVLTIAKAEGEQADTENTKADTLKILSEIDREDQLTKLDSQNSFEDLSYGEFPGGLTPG